MLLKKSTLLDQQLIQISGSKSISNRLLILDKLFENVFISNISNAQDTQLLQKALNSDSEVIDIHHAGTAMRFLTSYFAIQEGRTVTLTGSERMKQRPIKPLVDALHQLDADIEYLGEEGFPPLKITGKKITKNKVKISAGVSSQFITSLLLIGGKLENGISVELIGEITSRPYLEMTLKVLSNVDIESEFYGNTITVFKKVELPHRKREVFEVESDWTSASYYYSLAAIGKKTVYLQSFKSHSLQGDSALKEFYWNFFGINTITDEAQHKISLIPESGFWTKHFIKANLNNCPDIAQTLCVTATALKVPFEFDGLSTLKVKETDRILALQNELLKIGCETEITDESIKSKRFFEPEKNISIATYNDHRMAMSFAPFCLLHEIEIQDEDVVEKSYPDFWRDFFKITEPSEP